MINTRVESSVLRSIGYDAASEILEVEFNNGSIYQYFGVPRTVYEELMTAESHGQYFATNIRDTYEYELRQ